MTTTTQTLSLEEGKYTIYRTESTTKPGVDITLERYRERWYAAEPQFIGNKFLHLLVEKAMEGEDIAARARKVVEAADAGLTLDEMEDEIDALRAALSMPIPEFIPLSGIPLKYTKKPTDG